MKNQYAPKSTVDSIVESLISKLSENGILSPDSCFDKTNFINFKKQMPGKVILPGTTITPIMERVLFSIASSSSIKKIVVLGSYYGYALLWLTGGKNRKENSSVYGFDINKESCSQARINMDNLNLDNVQIIEEDAFNGINLFEDETIDLLFIDVEKDGSKSNYSPLLEQWYGKLKKGALVLAHDPLVEKFTEDFKEYHKIVNDKSRFESSLTLPIDSCGLDISIKKGRIESGEYNESKVY
ncbi:class I SAM-dependent methyltransferase [Heyndrickxia oleronia]|uniref:O-methyltransferase n=1 Tax=Heyndrickxia oleronia TaxID=38875 RepID=UPI00203C34FB|nr:class I SAM-dependent methyltransferase [Heyndrickxia oleronia]MCM3239547.1 class I SAM-dependent methyltransferase [Heyndrickxia oleronia]